MPIIDPSNAGFSPSEMDRRKFQQAVAVTLDRQAAALSATREFMADLSVRLDEQHQRVAVLEHELQMLREHYTAQQRACVTFLGRLRWFLGQ